jgi:hypothetical protein
MNMTAGDFAAYLCSTLFLWVGMEGFADEMGGDDIYDPTDGISDIKIEAHKQDSNITTMVY